MDIVKLRGNIFWAGRIQALRLWAKYNLFIGRQQRGLNISRNRQSKNILLAQDFALR
jgi:hypothetical protein